MPRRACDFRALTGAAPLKLKWMTPKNRTSRPFPRSHGRGSVEAGWDNTTWYRVYWNFRALTGAAPLKPPGTPRTLQRNLTISALSRARLR